MAEKTMTKKTDTPPQTEIIEDLANEAPAPATRADVVRARIEKQGYATDKDIADLRG